MNKITKIYEQFVNNTMSCNHVKIYTIKYILLNTDINVLINKYLRTYKKNGFNR